MKLFKSLFRFCTNTPTTSTSLTRYRYYTDIQAKQLMARPNELRQVMMNHIEQFGEMPIERYWKLALTDPQYGYYVHKNVFSKQGDFTTSPQISPLFGQMFGVWIVYFLKKTGIINQQTQQITKKFRIVELGGGRGFFIKDITKALFDLKVANNFDLTFIQVSDYNRKAQQDSVMGVFKQKDHFFKFQHEISTTKAQYFTSQNPDKNVNLTWVQTIQDLYDSDLKKKQKGQQVPFTIFVMNQFMDALPVTVLKYTQNGWKQKVLTKSTRQDLFFQLNPSMRDFPSKLTPTAENPKQGDQIQISPTSFLTMDLLAKMVSNFGGAILNVDYGGQGVFADSIRAIKDHRYIPDPYFWQVPGECDLSAYVNFNALAQFAEKNEDIKAYEAIPQGYFLQAMGIVPRIEQLKKNMNNEQNKKRIESQYDRLVLPSQMGQIYKVQIITKKSYGQIYPHIQTDQYSF